MFSFFRNNCKPQGNGQCVILTQEKIDKSEDNDHKVNQDYSVEIPVMGTTKTGSTSSGSSNSSGSSLTMSRYRLSYQQKTIEEDNATVKQVIKMLVAVVVFFILCWTPLITVNLLKGFGVLPEVNHGLLKEVVAGLDSVLKLFKIS